MIAEAKGAEATINTTSTVAEVVAALARTRATEEAYNAEKAKVYPPDRTD